MIEVYFSLPALATATAFGGVMWGRTSANQQYRAGNQYRAGLRAGLDRAGVRARASYDRGYGDGSYRQGYGPRVNYASSYAREDGTFDPAGLTEVARSAAWRQ